MKLGAHLPDFTWPGGPQTLGADLKTIASALDEGGFDRVSVMDHVFQITVVGPPELPMLEGYTALGFLAAATQRVKLLTLVTAVTYRDPGLLIKEVTTLDVLSGGRAIFGIGAAWNGEESAGLGLFFPPTAERFERLEETLQIALQMWAGDESPYRGKHYQLERPLNSPQTLQSPHPPILIGGGGERKTLRMVAQYAQSCNLAAGPELPRKLQVLREHCERLGTDYDAIEKTANYRFDLGENGENLAKTIDELGALAELGIDVAHGRVYRVETIKPIELLAAEVIPAVESY